MRSEPSGHLEHPRDDARDADGVQLVGPGRLEVRVLGAEHDQHPVAGEDVVDELDRAVLADRQRRQRVRVGDRVAQRQDGQRAPAARRGLVVVRGAHRSDPADRDGARPRGPAERQFHGQDPVLVGRVGGVGVDLGAQRDHAPERPALDLELLIDAVVGALGLALAGEHQLAAARSPAARRSGRSRRDRRARPRAAGRSRSRRRPAGEKPPRRARREPAIEHVPEQLVHLPPHPLEVGEEVPLLWHRAPMLTNRVSCRFGR